LNWDFYFGRWEQWFGEECPSELLIADMSLSIGDTFVVYCLMEPPDKVIYTVVDTATVNHRRTIFLRHPYVSSYDIKFVEGVGCSNLFDYGVFFDATGSIVRCCHKDGELVYHWQSREDDGNCIPSYVGIDDREVSQDISIYPNPAHESVWVSSSFGLQNIDIYNFQGLLVYSSQASGHRTEVPLEGLPAGTYLLRITTPAGTTTKKLLIQ
jgi:hypothetical protein